MFGLHRRLRGANVGHLAAFEMTSTIPNKHYGNAFRKRGYGQDVTWYFDEHVEADAVHEQVLRHEVVGDLLAREPQLESDVVFGIRAFDFLEEKLAALLMKSWTEGKCSLLEPIS